MPERPKTPDLATIEKLYDLRGELRSADGARRFAARRRSDGLDVVVTVARALEGGASNALGLFASDARLLAGVSHPNVARVLDAEWVGPAEFAVVGERVEGTSLRDAVAREELSTARIADILQDVHSSIGWAREIGVVHRTVTPDSLWIEQGSGQPFVSFAPAEIAVNALPDVCSDARTIGNLARMMLSGSTDAASSDEALTALRPDLAERVAVEVDAMRRCETGGQAPDVGGLLAAIAMNDALKAGELERVRVESELAEADRTERERWQAREREIEQRDAEHKRRLEEERATFQRQLAAERAVFEKRMLQEQRRLQAERSRLELHRAGAPLPVPEPGAHAAAPVDEGPAVVPVPGAGRPRWAVPALAVALVVLVMALLSGLGRRSSSSGAMDAGLPVHPETISGSSAGALDPSFGGGQSYWPETYSTSPPLPQQPDSLYTMPPYYSPQPPMAGSVFGTPYPEPATEAPRPIAEPIWSPPRPEPEPAVAVTPAPEPAPPVVVEREPEQASPPLRPDTVAPPESIIPRITPRATPSLPGIVIRRIPVPVPPRDTSVRP